MPEYFSFDYIKEQVSKPITGVVHIGAHYAEEAWEYDALGWSALWFEAHPDYCHAMYENLLNYPEQKGYELCLSDVDDEEVKFWVTRDEYASSMLKPAWHQVQNPHALISGYAMLKTTRFDTWANTNNASWIKWDRYNLLVLDVQGAEDKVFRGMGDYVDKFDGLISEYSTVEFYEEVPQLSDLDKLYGSRGFKRVYPDETNVLVHGDALYIRK
jgi:FkbM family methyltransferase